MDKSLSGGSLREAEQASGQAKGHQWFWVALGHKSCSLQYGTPDNQGKQSEVPAESPPQRGCVVFALPVEGCCYLPLASPVPAAGEAPSCHRNGAQKSRRSASYIRLQLIALHHRVLWRIQYHNPLHSPEMGAKTVAVNTEAPKSPSITWGTRRLGDPYPPSAPCCRDITAGGCMLPQWAFC